MVSGFTLKVIAEKNRAEQQAVNAETERNKAEVERKKAELERASAETERAKAETQRLTATQARKVAEVAQQETQAANVAALQQRDIANSARNVAEDARKQALDAQQIAQKERDRVLLANKSAETINNFLISIFEGVNPSAGGNRNASARDIIAAAEKKLGAVENALPEAQGELFKSLAFIYENLGDKKISAAYSLRAADAFGLAGRAFVRKRIYSLTIASGNLSRIEPEKAAALAQQAVDLARLHKGAEPRAYAASLNALILGHHAAQRYADAKPVIEEARAIYKAMGGDPWAIAGYPVFHYNAAMNLYHIGQFAESETAIREQIAYRLTIVPVFEQLLIAAYQLLAKTLQAQAKNAEAAATYNLAIPRSALHFGTDSPTHTVLLANHDQFLKESGYRDSSVDKPR